MSSPFAFLFDLDGTLVDTDHLHVDAYRTLLAEFGGSITLEFYKRHIMGAPNDAIMRLLFPNLSPDRHEELSERKEELFRSAVQADLAPANGLLDLIAFAERHGISMCVVTNAPRANAESMLQGLNLRHRLPTIVIGAELDRGKPDPLPYLEGLRRLNAVAERALAFEDSGPGVTAAARAGIRTFGMRTALDETALRVAGAADVITDFKDPRLWRAIATMTGLPAARAAARAKAT